MKHLLVGLVSIGFLALSAAPAQAQTAPREPMAKKTELFVGTGASQNGVVTTVKQHLSTTTRPIGYTVDDASAAPEEDFIEVFVGTDTGNNGVVSKDSDHAGGSTESIGFLSKKPIRGGTKLYSGAGPCNNGVATNNTRHAGCNTVSLGYALPRNWKH